MVDPAEVVASLRIGDHRELDKPRLRALFGLGVLAAGVFRTRSSARTDARPDAGAIFVVANPVAHGARLAAAVQRCLPSGAVTVADSRLASDEFSVGRSFPSLSPRSMPVILDRGRLRAALHLRRRWGRPKVDGMPGLAAEYFFLAQAIRFAAVEDELATLSPQAVVIADFDRPAYTAPWIVSARASQRATVTLVHGSPNVEYYLPVGADHVFVWGEVQREWFARYESPAQAHIVGRPDFPDVTAPDDGSSALIVVHSREILSPREQSALIAVIADARKEGTRTELRVHPSVPVAQLDASWRRVAEAVDATTSGRDAFGPSLRARDRVVAVASSSVMDALARGVDVRIVADRERPLPADLAALRAEDDVRQDGGLEPRIRRERYIAARGGAAERLFAATLASLS